MQENRNNRTSAQAQAEAKKAEKQRKRKERRSVGHLVTTILVLLIILIILLLLHSCGALRATGEEDSTPFGDFSITGQQQQSSQPEPEEDEEKPSITFAGYGKCTVSQATPNIELKNPEGNFVDMVFTVTDRASGTVIAKTDKVPSGKFAYVNVMNFYTQPGTYWLDITISTSDAETGSATNGMNQAVELTVQ